MQPVGVHSPGDEEVIEREGVPQLNARGVARDDYGVMGQRIVDGIRRTVGLILSGGLRGMARRAPPSRSSENEGRRRSAGGVQESEFCG